MATALINWSFNPQTGSAPVASCSFVVLVTRDGVSLPSFSVSTSAAGVSSGVYQDATASANLTHQYRFAPQRTGCAANCTMTDAVVLWSCAASPPPPPPPPTGVSGCPTGENNFHRCGSTSPSRQVIVGGAVSIVQNFIDTTSVVISPTVPGLTYSTTATGGTVSGAASTAGTYNIQFTGIKTGCTDCVITYPLVVGAATASATQAIRIVRGASAYTPASLTSFNSADQLLEVSLTGPVGQTFQLVGTGTINSSSEILAIPPSGTFTFNTPVGQASSYSTAWGFVPATKPGGSTPVSLTNPAAVTITGSTCLVLAATQTGSTYSFTVTAPPGANAVPFFLAFGGASFNASSNDCASPTVGIVPPMLNTAQTGGGNVFTYPPVTVTAPYAASIKLALEGTPAFDTHVVCGATCVRVVFP